jgi:phosphoribosylformylglycinamidine synthase subunit PurL
VILLIGDPGVIDGSEYLGRAEGRPPEVDVAREVAGIELVIRAAEEGLLRSAHDVSGGGLAVALAESAIAGGRGAKVRVGPGRRDDEVLFGEGGGRVLVTVAGEEAADRMAAMADGVAVARIGTVGGEDLVIRVGEREARLPLDEARAAHEGGLPGALA